jgi:hypothetical protein
MKDLDRLNSFIKKIAISSEIGHYMPYANIFNENYAARHILFNIKHFAFEPFSAIMKDHNVNKIYDIVESTLKDKPLAVIDNMMFGCITGNLYTQKIIYGFSMLNFDMKSMSCMRSNGPSLRSATIVPICIGQCFVYETGVKTTVVEIITSSNQKLKWNFDLDIKTSLKTIRATICKMGCTHIIPGGYYYASNNTKMIVKQPSIISMQSYLMDADYVKFLISGVEAEMMYNSDYRIRDYCYLVVKLYMKIFPSILQVILRIAEVTMSSYISEDKSYYDFTITDDGKQIVLFSCSESDEIMIYPDIKPLEFADYKSNVIYQVCNDKNFNAVLDMYQDPAMFKYEDLDEQDVPGCAVIDFSGMNREQMDSFVLANYYYKTKRSIFDEVYKRPFLAEINDVNWVFGYNDLYLSRSKIIDRFKHSFDSKGRVKLDCYLPGMKLGFKKILDHTMIYSRDLTMRYSDAGILATEMFLLCLPSTPEIAKAIQMDNDRDVTLKLTFPVMCGNSFVNSGSICIEVWERYADALLLKMPLLNRVLYYTFYSKLIFIAHAWLCAITTCNENTTEFLEFVADYELYIKSLRKLMCYYIKLYPY